MAHGTDHGVDHHLPSENDPRFWTSRLLETLNASFKLFVYFKILIIYLVVAGLGCGRQDLHCVMWDVSLQRRDSLAAHVVSRAHRLH